MLRYIKRFTGTKRRPDYKLVLQQWVDDIYGIENSKVTGNQGRWQDLNESDAQWETSADAVWFERASKYEEMHAPR